MKTQIQFQIALERGGKRKAWGVVVPDLRGCFSAGATLEEALANAREAILLHLQALLERGDPMPMPRSMEDRVRDSKYKNWIWAIVSVDLTQLEGPAERVNLTIPRGFLVQIDAAARVAGESRSAFMVRAAIARATPPTAQRARRSAQK